MAEKRMFTKKITESDAFLDMPLSAQALYFHLNMNADDDGFVNNPKMIARIIGAKNDDLKILEDRRFVLPFPSGVIVIKHWRMNNTIQADRYKKTSYAEELSQLDVKDNKSYTWKQFGNGLETEWKQFGNGLETQIRLDKTSIDKTSIDNTFAPPSDEGDAVARIPLNKKDTYHLIFQEDIDHYKELYPAVDVEQEVRAMVGWCEANPNNRKTKRGIKHFINNWLNKAQNKSRAYSERNKSGVNYIDIE